jgi:hypothetical protein
MFRSPETQTKATQTHVALLELARLMEKMRILLLS